MSLLTYQEARPWAKAIQDEVLERRMPPWGAVKGFGDFAGDSGLSQEEIHLLSDWVDGGAPEGDPIYLPAVPPAVDAKKQRLQGEIAVSTGSILPSPVTLRAISPERLREGGSMRVVARFPDSRIEPLLWIYNFKRRFARTYVYRSPIMLPAGTRIEVSPSGRVMLSAAPSPAK
jgi:hypothetical protein